MEANFLNSSDSIDAVKDKRVYTLGLNVAQSTYAENHFGLVFNKY